MSKQFVVKLSPICNEHLEKIVAAMKANGKKTSKVAFVNNLIMDQPIPGEQDLLFTLTEKGLETLQQLSTKAPATSGG